MILDDIIAALKSSDAVPKAALAEGVDHSNELAPKIYAIADKFCHGTHLLPADNALLFYGLHVLAAAGHPGLCEQLIALARQPDDDLDKLFPLHSASSLTRLLLSVWPDDMDQLCHLLEFADIAPDAKWALYDVLARLTFDGRVPRDRTIAFLTRVERDNLIDDGDIAWWGWEQAVVRLGLVDLEPALRRIWSKPVYEQHSQADHAEMLDALKRAAADPECSTGFDADHVKAIDDPVEAVGWIEHRAAIMANLTAAQDGEPNRHSSKDADNGVGLTSDERQWLASFLVSRQVPDSAMSLEMLDGFFTALVIGPEAVLSSEYLPVIWGTNDGGGPEWYSDVQAEYVLTLLTKHWNAIATRRSASAEHDPIIEEFGVALPGEEWSDGFLTGIDVRGAAWEPMMQDRRADQVVLPILALSSDTPAEIQDQLSSDVRETIIDQLPAILQMIAAYWRSSDSLFPRRQPNRAAKIGRNAPCPCGSGKKFKRCCGSAVPPLLH